MAKVNGKESSKLLMLPQAPEQGGYYTYGTPANGAGQFAHPALLSLLCMVEHRWQSFDERKFGVGNISKEAGGKFPPHSSHQFGLDVDIRCVRKDGQHSRVSRFDEQYDGQATQKLIELFISSGKVKFIYFNDLAIPGVKAWPSHGDHFHVSVKL